MKPPARAVPSPGWLFLLGLWAGWLAGGPALAQPFQLPTANRNLLAPGGEAAFFAPTPGRTWESGAFGCVRTDRLGPRLHEGIDILFQQRDRRGEPLDPVRCAADGELAYLNDRPGLSNYGRYLMVRHRVEGLEVYSLYAHLAAIQPGLRMGDRVRAGDRLGTMGRSTNTREGIGRDRAHLHFELNLVLHERYAAWHARTHPDQRNDHGNFHGHNFLGLDPAQVFREQQRLGAAFSLLRLVRAQPELCRVLIRTPSLSFARRYPQFVERNPLAERQGVAGYELGLAFNGIPIRIIPRSAAELAQPGRIQVLSVSAAERESHPCGRLLVKRGQAWTLTARGDDLLGLLAF